MLTGTHLLQSCGIVLCEIETAEHQEQLFAINFKCFNTLKAPPPPLPSPHSFFLAFTRNLPMFFLLCPSLVLFVSLVFQSFFIAFVLSFLVCLPSSTVFALLVSLRPAERHVQAWQLPSRLGFSSTGLSHPHPPTDITLSSSDRHQSQRAESICLISYLLIKPPT